MTIRTFSCKLNLTGFRVQYKCLKRVYLKMNKIAQVCAQNANAQKSVINNLRRINIFASKPVHCVQSFGRSRTIGTSICYLSKRKLFKLYKSSLIFAIVTTFFHND